MNILLIIAVLFSVLAICEEFLKNKPKTKWSIAIGMMALLAILYCTAKKGVFYDTIEYANDYLKFYNMSIKDILIKNYYEPGWRILNKITGLIFGPNPIFIRIVVYLIVSCLYTISILKYSKRPILSVMLFFLLGFWGMSGAILRQGLAMSLIFLSLKYIYEKKLVKFLILILLATSFHYSAAIFLIAFPIAYLQTDKKMLSFSLITTILFLIFGKYIIEIVSNLFNKNYEVVPNANYLFFLMVLIAAYGQFIYLIIIKNTDKEIEFLSKLMLVTPFLSILSFYNYSFVRLAYIFLVCEIILIPNLINTLKLKKLYCLAIGGVIILSLFYYIFICKYNEGAMFEYLFLWQK